MAEIRKYPQSLVRCAVLTNPKQFKECKKDYGMGECTLVDVPSFDITKWPRKLRAKYAFDHKDPLADIPEKDLKESKIMLA